MARYVRGGYRTKRRYGMKRAGKRFANRVMPGWSGYLGRTKLGKPRLIPHKFTRYVDDVHLGNDAAGNMVLYDTNGVLQGTSFAGYQVGPTGTGVNGLVQYGLVLQGVLGNILNHTDFTRLFDRYRIKGISVKIIPMSTVARTNSVDSIGELTYRVDYDDIAMPATQNDLLESELAHSVRLTKPISIFYKPRAKSVVIDELGNQVAVALGTNKQWLDCQNPFIPHFGLKMFFNDINRGSATVNSLFKLRTKFYFEMKDTQ